jgi:uncharacterized protein
MSMRYHQMPKDLFDALAAGGGAPAAIRELAIAQHSKHLVLLESVFGAARDSGGPDTFAASGYQLLAAVQRHDREAANEVIRYPSVGAWARRTIHALRGGMQQPGAEPAGLSLVAAAAAIRAKLTAEIEVPATAGIVVLPSLGAAEVTGPTAMVRTAAGAAEILSAGQRITVPAGPYRDAPGWLGLRRIRAGSLDVLVDDLDPFRMPAMGNVAPRLGGTEAIAWENVLRDAWLLLEQRCHDMAVEAAAAITVIVPLCLPDDGQVSSTSEEAFGAISMSPPPDPFSCAVTLAHELQHLKLSALLLTDSLTKKDDGRRYYAPWRDDPRPVSGLLQGAYAYLGVSGFWRQQRQSTAGADRHRADKEFARWRVNAAEAVETLLACGQLTAKGVGFVGRMSETLGAWQAEPVSLEALAAARRESSLHRARWKATYGSQSAR